LGSAKESSKNSGLGFGLFVMTLTHVLTHVFGRLYTASFPIIRDEFSFSIQQLGLIAAIPPLVQALFSIPCGILTDRFGSKRMLLVSLALAVVGSVLAAASRDPVMLIIAVCMVYINTTIYHPAAYSFTTRQFSRRDRSKVLGIHGAGANVGVALGPLTLSLFLGVLGLTWRHVYLFWAIPIGLSAFFVLKLSEIEADYVPEEDQDIEETGSGDARSLFTLGLVMFLVYTSFRTVAQQIIGTFMPIFIVDYKGFTVEQMGLIYGSTSLTGLVSAPVGGLLASKFGAKRWLAVSIVLNMMALAFLPYATGGLVFVALYMAYGFSGSLGMAARSALIANLTPRSQRGMGYALLFLPGSIMGAISPVIAARLIENFGMKQLFPISIGIGVLGLAVLVFGIKDS
jgi:MFS family permease